MPSEAPVGFGGRGPTPTPDCAAPLPESVLIRPRWPAPRGVGALMSTRGGGVSAGPCATLNLGRRAGDSADAVAENRRRFAASLRRGDGEHEHARAPARPVWLHQVHGTDVLELDAHTPEQATTPADAAWTRTPGVACVVGAADCLPVLLALRDGSAVAAAHAGWRGLAFGVLEKAVQALCQGAPAHPGEVVAWLGPCIGPRQFEVGADVLQAFGVAAADTEGLRDAGGDAADRGHFVFRPRADGAPRWLADLQGLARARLARLGVQAVSAEPACTHEEASRFFSFRRDGHASGRMAAAIWIER